MTNNESIKLNIELGIGAAEKELKQLQKNVADLNATMARNGELSKEDAEDLKELKDRQKEVAASLKEMKDGQEAMGEATKSFRTQCKELQEELTRLRLEGKEGSEEYQNVANRLGTLRDAMSDAAREANSYANDTRKLSLAIGAFRDVTAVYGAVTSAMHMFGVENESVENTIKKLMVAQTALNSIQQVYASVLDKSTILGKSFMAVQKSVKVAMKASGDAADKAAVAFKSLGKSLSVNPWILAVTAVAGVIYKVNDLIESEKEENRALIEQNRLRDEAALKEKQLRIEQAKRHEDTVRQIRILKGKEKEVYEEDAKSAAKAIEDLKKEWEKVRTKLQKEGRSKSEIESYFKNEFSKSKGGVGSFQERFDEFELKRLTAEDALKKLETAVNKNTKATDANTESKNAPKEGDIRRSLKMLREIGLNVDFDNIPIDQLDHLKSSKSKYEYYSGLLESPSLGRYPSSIKKMVKDAKESSYNQLLEALTNSHEAAVFGSLFLRTKIEDINKQISDNTELNKRLDALQGGHDRYLSGNYGADEEAKLKDAYEKIEAFYSLQRYLDDIRKRALDISSMRDEFISQHASEADMDEEPSPSEQQSAIGKDIKAQADKFGFVAESAQKIAEATSGLIDEIFESMVDNLQEKLDKVQELINESTEKIKMYEDAISDYEDKLADASSQDSELLLGNLNANKEAMQQEMAALEKQKAEEKRLQQQTADMQYKQKRADLSNQLLAATAAIALGISNAVAQSPFTGGLPGSAIAGTIGAIQIATIASQIARLKPTKLENGGLLSGPSHANGGIPIPGTGLEVEGGEMVISKRATKAFFPLLQAINNSLSNSGTMFKGGTTLPVVDTFKMPEVYVTVTDIQRESDRMAIVKDL